MDTTTEPRRPSPSGVRILVLVLSLMVLALVALVAVMAFTLDLGDPRQSESDSGYQNWAVIASFVVGTAAAISVAWATVRLAQSAHDTSSEALEISRQQERRETLAFFEPRTEALMERFWELSLALSGYAVSTMSLYSDLHDAPKKDTPPYIDLPSSDLATFERDAQERLGFASNSVGRLRTALSALSHDATSRIVVQDALEHLHPGGLKNTVQRLSDENLSEPGLERLIATDLPELENLLAIREREVARVGLQALVGCQVAATNMSGGDAALSSLMFAGNLLWENWSRGSYVSFGTALLSDLKQMLPIDREAMARAITKAYPGMLRETDISARLPAGKLFDLGASLEQSFGAFSNEPWRVAFPPLSPTTE